MTPGRDYSIDVKFYRLSPAAEPYFTALYAFTFDCPPDAMIEDYLHPEWTAMRFSDGHPPAGCVGPGPLVQQSPFVATGPTSGPLHFGLRKSRIWGLGLQPRGWAKFACGDASDITDRIVDGMDHVAFDGQYYDQAQFVKEFRDFMGMTPSEYAEMPHPVLERIMGQRMADQGAAPDPGLLADLPTVLRYGSTGQ